MAQRRQPSKEYKEDHSRFDNVNRIFGSHYQEQTLELTQGKHEIQIQTEDKPKRIWLSFEDNSPIIDKLGSEITENGFVLFATIVSATRKIRWFVSLSKGKSKHKRKQHEERQSDWLVWPFKHRR